MSASELRAQKKREEEKASAVSKKNSTKQPKYEWSLISKKRKKELVIAPAEFAFWLHNGGALQSLIELEEAFKRMTVDQYRYHVGKGKNDFAKWTEEILKDKEVANELRKVKNLKEAVATVQRRLKEYAI